MKRRDFLKLSIGGVATIVVGSKLGWLCGEAEAAHLNAGQTLNIIITDAIKEMVTHNSVNTAECYFWGYHMETGTVNAGVFTKAEDVPYECPGPTLLVTKGETITFWITNTLDEPHALYIPGRLPDDPPQFDSGAIAPGATVTGTFTTTQVGAFLYYDNLNSPVNRVMGLHGALVVRPSEKAAGHKFTPYDPALVSTGVQKLYDDFGGSNHFPGLAWEEGDASTWIYSPAGQNIPSTVPFRQYVWLTHQASPNLFAEVGNYPAGQDYPADVFLDKFLKSPFSPTKSNYNPQYFTINGQSGMMAHFGPYNTPIGRVGEPAVVHILNAGLWTHSMHLHANHFYVTSMNGVVSENPIWVDVYNVKPMDRIDYTIPFMRPPDLPNVRGIGYPDTPLVSPATNNPVWPPVEELDLYIPARGEKMAQRADGTVIDLEQRMSPLCYPMHDHSEPSQTAQGGNYNCGLISGIYFTGDRNTPGHKDFPMDEDFRMMYRNVRGCEPGVWPPAGDTEETMKTAHQ